MFLLRDPQLLNPALLSNMLSSTFSSVCPLITSSSSYLISIMFQAAVTVEISILICFCRIDLFCPLLDKYIFY